MVLFLYLYYSMVRCELSLQVYEALGVVLRSGNSRIKSLSVGVNQVGGDEGAKHLWTALADQRCLLEHLE